MQILQALYGGNYYCFHIPFIVRQFEYRNKYVTIQIYKMVERPHLEDSIQFWSSWLKNRYNVYEGSMMRFT